MAVDRPPQRTGIMGGRFPYIFVGICWLLLMVSFFTSSDELDTPQRPGNKSQRSAADDQEGPQETEDGIVKRAEFQCSDTTVISYTVPPRVAEEPWAVDVPRKRCKRYNPRDGFVIARNHAPQRRVPQYKLNSSDLRCVPCSRHAYHGLGASARRLLYITSFVNFRVDDGSTLKVRDVYLAVNLDAIFLTSTRPNYDEHLQKYFAYTPLHTMPIPSVGTVTAMGNDYEVNLGNSSIEFTTDIKAEARSLMRTLMLFSRNALILDECDGRVGACTRVCPQERLPYLPCAAPIGEGPRTAPYKRTKAGARVIHHTPADPARIAVGIAGYMRSAQFTAATLREYVLDPHDRTIEIYASTWNVIGQMRGGLMGYAERVVPSERIRSILRAIYNPYLRDVDILDHNQYETVMKLLAKRQFYEGASHHIHISNVIRLIRETSKQFDFILLTRFDTHWNTPVQFVTNHFSVFHFLVRYDAKTSPVHHHAVRIIEGHVAVHASNTEFAGNAWAVGDFAVAGLFKTMIRLEDLYTYALENFVSAPGSGFVLDSFFAENGIFWEVSDMELSLTKIKCVKVHVAEISREAARLLHEPDFECYWNLLE